MFSDKLPLKCWADADRPREKLLEQGKNALSDAELLAILIGSGSREDTAVELCRKILSSVNNDLFELGKMDLSALQKFKGIGEAKALTIMAALEIGRRRKDTAFKSSPAITSSQDAADHFLPVLMDLPHEEFWVLYLSRSNRVVKQSKISAGGVSGTVVDARMVFKPALEILASSVILCHNHPSGNKSPSDADIKLTKKLREAGSLLEVQVLDHLIICGNSYYSFADNGVI